MNRNIEGKNQWTDLSSEDKIMRAVTIESNPGIIYKYTSTDCIKIVLQKEPCWVFNGFVEKTGYTRMIIDGKRIQAHRHSWQVFNGKTIPKGLVIDHLCLRKNCLNPSHLEVVTPTENDRRARFHYPQQRTHCKKGHELVDPNIKYHKVSPTRTDRQCRICLNASKRAYYHRTKS